MLDAANSLSRWRERVRVRVGDRHFRFSTLTPTLSRRRERGM
jgi:hypothetical protein